jgi:hypothetical protein
MGSQACACAQTSTRNCPIHGNRDELTPSQLESVIRQASDSMESPEQTLRSRAILQLNSTVESLTDSQSKNDLALYDAQLLVADRMLEAVASSYSYKDADDFAIHNLRHTAGCNCGAKSLAEAMREAMIRERDRIASSE